MIGWEYNISMLSDVLIKQLNITQYSIESLRSYAGQISNSQNAAHISPHRWAMRWLLRLFRILNMLYHLYRGWDEAGLSTETRNNLHDNPDPYFTKSQVSLHSEPLQLQLIPGQCGVINIRAVGRIQDLSLIWWSPDNTINLKVDQFGQKWSLETESYHDANFVITGSTGGCHNDNLRCHQWWQSWHYDNSQFSVI